MIGDNVLPALAADIRAAHAGVRASAIHAAEQALRAGRLLIEARALVVHGAWAEWLQEHVGFSDRSARRYMQLARSGLNSATVAEMGLRASAEALAEGRGPLPLPDVEIEIFASPAMDYHEPFAAVRERSPGWFGLCYMADDEIVIMSKAIAFAGLEHAISVASAGRLQRSTWCWRHSDYGVFVFLAQFAEWEQERGKPAALHYAKHLALAEIDRTRAEVSKSEGLHR